MKILQVFPTWQSVVPNELKNKLVVVIDVLRATNTIITALNNGTQEILPVAEVDEAWQIKNKYPHYLLGGERFCQKIDGFDFGNSPLEYIPEKVKQRGIIITTSNGSRALKTADKADRILIASLANSKAVSQKLTTLQNDIAVICAGTLGSPSLEDTLAAGKIIKEMVNLKDYQLDDYSYLALATYDYHQTDIFTALTQSQNGRRLKELNLEDDIKYCSQIDTTIIVPEYKKGHIYL